MPCDKARTCVMIGPEGNVTIDFQINRRCRTAEITFYQNFIKLTSYIIDHTVALNLQKTLTSDGWHTATYQYKLHHEF